MKNVLQRGQALITLLFFVIIAMAITGAALVISVTSSTSGINFQQSFLAYEAAKSGGESALLRLLRDPAYTGGDTFTVGTGTTTIQIALVGSQYTILSIGKVGNAIRSVQITATYTNGLLTVIDKKEIF